MDNIIQLIEGCRNQDSRSQKILYESFFGYGLKIAYRYVYNYDTAVNVTNDGFVKIFQNINRFDSSGNEFPERLLMAWMKRIIINTSIDELRKNNLSRETGLTPELVWQMPDDSQKADNLVLYKELINSIRSLPPMYRIVFNMYVVDGCAHSEIAKNLGITVGTSKSNLARARRYLQKMIKAYDQVSMDKPAEANTPNKYRSRPRMTGTVVRNPEFVSR